MTTRLPWLSIIVLAGCADQAPVEGRACPCTDGYVCCSTNVCVAAGEACSVSKSGDAKDPLVDDDDPLAAHPCMADIDKKSTNSVEHWVYEYDAMGNRLRESGDFGNDGTVNELAERTYNDTDKIITEDLTEEGVHRAHATWTYDLLGRTVSDVVVYPEETSASTWTYAGNTATDEHTDHGQLWYRAVYEEDEAGRAVTATTTNSDGALASTETWTYSDAGKLIAHDSDLVGGYIARDTYTRDAEGRLLTFVETYADAFFYSWTNTYDEQGRLVTRTLLANVADTTTYHYCP